MNFQHNEAREKKKRERIANTSLTKQKNNGKDINLQLYGISWN
jgi:hypothetical protein